MFRKGDQTEIYRKKLFFRNNAASVLEQPELTDDVSKVVRAFCDVLTSFVRKMLYHDGRFRVGRVENCRHGAPYALCLLARALMV